MGNYERAQKLRPYCAVPFPQCKKTPEEAK